MTAQDRKEKAMLHKELINILTNCKNDETYLKRLIWANEIINSAIGRFTDKEYEKIIKKLERI